MEQIGPRITGVEHKVESIKEAVERMVENQSGNQNVTTVKFEAGAAGIWLCVTACLVMFVLTVITGILFLDLSRKYDRMQDYQNIILQHAPELREIIKKEMDK